MKSRLSWRGRGSGRGGGGGCRGGKARLSRQGKKVREGRGGVGAGRATLWPRDRAITLARRCPCTQV